MRFSLSRSPVTLVFCCVVLCISAAYAVVQCLSVTFVYGVKMAKDAAIVPVECE